MRRDSHTLSGSFSFLYSLLRISADTYFYLFLCFLFIFIAGIQLLSIPCECQYPFLILPQLYQFLTIPRFVPNQVILYFEPGTTRTQIFTLYALYGLKEISFSPVSGARSVLTSPQFNLQELIVRLNMEAIVLLAEPNFVGQVSFIPNDPYYQYQWHLRAINCENAWNLSTGPGVVAAVLDTGVAFENFDIYGQAPDLAGTRFVAGWDFVNNDANPDDDNGHGTHLTGTIAQTTNNFYGCAGVAFNATIMPVKVMDSTGTGNLTEIVDGIYFAVNNGAKVINMSFGFGDNPTLSLETAVNYAYTNNVVMVCSAGNNATDLPNYPASYPVCISVSAVRYDLTFGSYSNYGADIDICAPGGDLSVDQNLDGYPDGILQQSHDGTDYTVFKLLLGKGTSWAAAHVTGTVALMQSLSGGLLTPDQVDLILKQSALDLGAPGWDQYFGYGLIDAYTALLGTTQATIASAEAIFATRVLLPSAISIFQVAAALNPLVINQNSTVTNPVATISGDLLPFDYLSPAQFGNLFQFSNPLSFPVYPFNTSLTTPFFLFPDLASLPLLLQFQPGLNMVMAWNNLLYTLPAIK